MADDIKQALDKLSEWQKQRAIRIADKQALIDLALEPVKDRLQEIEEEFAKDIETANKSIESLTKLISDSVKDRGETVKGSSLQAVYSKPRVTWDSSKLEGLMIALPALSEARKVGEASVSIRAVKEKE